MVMSLGLVCRLPWKNRWLGRSRGRGKKRRRGDNFVAPEICFDLLIEILARLPCKSLMRFKCVSKLWFSLIRSPFFTNRYRTIARRSTRRLYMSFMEHIYCDTLELCCPEPPGKSLLMSFSMSSSKFDKDLSILGIGGRNMIVFRGLILYNVCRKACIYNPATRQRILLPAVESNIFAQDEYCKYQVYFFAHDPVLDQYKVICTVFMYSENFERISSEHWVFLLGPGGFWKRIEFDQPHVFTRPTVCINGIVYYLAATSMSRNILVSFDVRSEEFSMIETPHAAPSSISGHVGFIDYGGKPTMVDYTHLGERGLMDLWILEEDEKWSKKSFVLQASQMHLVNGIDLLMESATPNGQLILAPSELFTHSYFLYYDLQRNDLSKVMFEVYESDLYPFTTEPDYCFKHMDESESIMHLEI